MVYTSAWREVEWLQLLVEVPIWTNYYRPRQHIVNKAVMLRWLINTSVSGWSQVNRQGLSLQNIEGNGKRTELVVLYVNLSRRYSPRFNGGPQLLHRCIFSEGTSPPKWKIGISRRSSPAGNIILSSIPEVRRAFTANPIAKESPAEHPNFSKKSKIGLPLSEKALVPNIEQKISM